VGRSVPCTECTLIAEQPSWWSSPSAKLLDQIFDILMRQTYLVEHGLGLTTITTLLAIITTLSLGEQRRLSGLVLCDLVLGVCYRSVRGL
jgi:hypothetical protein